MAKAFFFRLFPLLALAIAIALTEPAEAAKAGKGRKLPARLRAGQTELVLNGMALKEVSIFAVDVYVVGLYLQHPSRDWKEIVDSRDPKLVRFRFTRDVGRDALIDSWTEDLREGCRGRCEPLIRKVRKMRASLPDVRSGNEMDYVFTQEGLTLLLNGRSVGRFTEPADSRAVLATLIGEHSPSPELRQALLGARKK